MREDDAAMLEEERRELIQRLIDEQGLTPEEAREKADWGREANDLGNNAFFGFGGAERSWYWTAVGFAALAVVAVLFMLLEPNGR